MELAYKWIKKNVSAINAPKISIKHYGVLNKMEKKYAFDSYWWQVAAEIEQMSDRDISLWLLKTAIKENKKK